MGLSIDVLLFEGFDELDAIAPFEVFQNAAGAGADCEVSLVTREPQDRVTASHGLDVGVDGQLAEPGEADAPDLLVVPGGGWSSGENRGVRREYDAGELSEAVATHFDAGATIASVCTGAMLLERAGILGDKPAITHQSAVPDLRDAGVEVPDKRLVDAGDVVTAGGVTSGLDLALYLVQREFGEAIADQVSTEMEYEMSDDILIRR
jgi:transcriptional regulator GlxA family with amidase domain